METPTTPISSEQEQTTPDLFVQGSYQLLPSVLLEDLSRRNADNKPVLEHLDIAVYAVLKSHARLQGKCFPSLDRVARFAACSVSTVQRSLKRLDAAGHIQRKCHNKGKIHLLTDVTAQGQVVRKNRIVFAPKPAAPCKASLTPPENVQAKATASSSAAVAQRPKVKLFSDMTEDERALRLRELKIFPPGSFEYHEQAREDYCREKGLRFTPRTPPKKEAQVTHDLPPSSLLKNV